MPYAKKYADAAAKQRAYRQRQREARLAELTAKGLPPLPAIATMPSRERWQGLIEQARIALQTAHDEMATYWDERSEIWQASERGEAMQDRIEALDQVIEQLDDLQDD
jgi:hypothetical protein